MEQGILQQLKAAFGCRLFSSDINNVTYVYRALSDAEFKSITNSAGSDAQAEDFIVQNAIVYPQEINFAKMKAGYITALADKILTVSGFSDPTIIVNALDEARNESVGDIRFSMKAFIIATMSSYLEEDLDRLDIYELTKKVILAERVAKMQQDVAGIQMEQPPLFYVRPLDEDADFEHPEPAPEPQRPQPRRQPPKETKVDKQALLSQLRSTEKEASTGTYGIRYEEAFDEFREEELVRLSGKPREDDPIAEKLRRALM